MIEQALKEQTLRIGRLTGILRRAGIIKENEVVVNLEFDEQINLVTLYLEEKEG